MTKNPPKLPPDITRHIADHIALYRRDPEAAQLWDSSIIGIPGPVKTLLLTTTGRRSGKPRHAALQYFVVDGHYVVVGSKGGLPDHPAWVLNLLAHPACTLQVGAVQHATKARVAEGDERASLWQEVTAEQPEYLKYQSRTDREIPVILFELD